jgi:hypothetical protein
MDPSGYSATAATAAGSSWLLGLGPVGWAIFGIVVAVVAVVVVVDVVLIVNNWEAIQNFVATPGLIRDWGSSPANPAVTIPVPDNTGVFTWDIPGARDVYKFYNQPKPHRKHKGGDKHSQAQRARKLQQGGQKKVINGRFKPRNPSMFIFWDINNPYGHKNLLY